MLPPAEEGAPYLGVFHALACESFGDGDVSSRSDMSVTAAPSAYREVAKWRTFLRLLLVTALDVDSNFQCVSRLARV